MKRKWTNHELLDHWTLEAEETRLVLSKKGGNYSGLNLSVDCNHFRG